MKIVALHIFEGDSEALTTNGNTCRDLLFDACDVTVQPLDDGREQVSAFFSSLVAFKTFYPQPLKEKQGNF